MPYTEAELAAAKRTHQAWLRQQEGFGGAGIGISRNGQPCIKIFSNQMPPATKTAITSRLGDLPVEFEEAGEFRKF